MVQISVLNVSPESIPATTDIDKQPPVAAVEAQVTQQASQSTTTTVDEQHPTVTLIDDLPTVVVADESHSNPDSFGLGIELSDDPAKATHLQGSPEAASLPSGTLGADDGMILNDDFYLAGEPGEAGSLSTADTKIPTSKPPELPQTPAAPDLVAGHETNLPDVEVVSVPDVEVLHVPNLVAESGTHSFESLLAQKSHMGQIKPLNTNKGPGLLIEGNDIELKQLQTELQARGILTAMEGPDSPFGEGLRIKSNSTEVNSMDNARKAIASATTAYPLLEVTPIRVEPLTPPAAPETSLPTGDIAGDARPPARSIRVDSAPTPPKRGFFSRLFGGDSTPTSSVSTGNSMGNPQNGGSTTISGGSTTVMNTGSQTPNNITYAASDPSHGTSSTQTFSIGSGDSSVSVPVASNVNASVSVSVAQDNAVLETSSKPSIDVPTPTIVTEGPARNIKTDPTTTATLARDAAARAQNLDSQTGKRQPSVSGVPLPAEIKEGPAPRTAAVNSNSTADLVASLDPAATGGSRVQLLPEQNVGGSGATSPSEINNTSHVPVESHTRLGNGAMNSYFGAEQLSVGLSQLQNGNTLGGAGNIVVGGFNTVSGAAESAGVFVAGKIPPSVTTFFERANVGMMMLSSAVEIYNAPADKKGDAALRSMTTTVSAFAAGDAAAAAGLGAVGGMLLPVGVAIGAGMLIDRGLDMQDLQAKHGHAMTAINADSGHTHLQALSEKLHTTIDTAAVGDQLNKDSNGKIDFNDEANLSAAKKLLINSKQWQDVQANCIKTADQMLGQEDVQRSGAGGYVPDMLTAEERQAKRQNMIADLEKSSLQSTLGMLQTQRDIRDSYLPNNATLTYDANNNIDLTNPKNVAVVRGVLTRMHEDAEKGVKNTESMNYFLNLKDGTAELRAHYAQEEMLKTVGVATAELDAIRFKSSGKDVAITPEQQAADKKMLNDAAKAQAKANHGVQNIRADYFYVDHGNGYDQQLTSSDTRNQKMPDEVVADFDRLKAKSALKGENPVEFSINQTLYKDDGKGHQVPTGIVVWHLINQEAMQAEDKAAGKKPRDYLNDVEYGVNYTTGNTTIATKGSTQTHAAEKSAPKIPEKLDPEFAKIITSIEKKGLGAYFGDGDKKITLDEVRKTFAENKITGKMIDTNNDGIDAKEVESAISKFHVQKVSKKTDSIVTR